MSQNAKSAKNLLERFDKDVKGGLTALLIVGIILKEKRVWSYQIKKSLNRITPGDETISNSSLYTLLGRLESDYNLIYSEKDEEFQRRFFMPTDICDKEFNKAKTYWYNFIKTAKIAIDLLDED